MQYRAAVPDLGRMVGETRLLRWSKTEGDRIEFGDELCVLEVVTKLMQVREAPVITSRRGAAGRWPWSRPVATASTPGDVEERPVPGTSIQLVSSDEGVLRRVLVQPGDPVTVGTTLAITASTPEEALPVEASDATPLFRVVVEKTRDDRDEADEADDEPGDDDGGAP